MEKYSAYEIWQDIPSEDKEDKAYRKEWVKVNDMVNLIEKYICLSLRLNCFGAEFDNKIKTKVMRNGEPTTKATEYLKELLQEIKKMNEEE